jgi:hypothetical protein
LLYGKCDTRNYLINGNFYKWDYAASQTSSVYGSDNRLANNYSGSTKASVEPTMLTVCKMSDTM